MPSPSFTLLEAGHGQGMGRGCLFFFRYIRGWTWAEFGNRMPFLSALIVEAGHELSMGRGCLILPLLLY